MLYLLLAIVSFVSMSHMFKWGDKHNVPKGNLLFINYAVAALLTFAQGYDQFHTNYSPSFYGLASVTGFMFAFNFVLFYISIQRIGISISNSIIRIAISIPTLASIFIYKEHLSIYSGLGLGLTVLALPLATPKAQKGITQKLNHSWWFAVVLFLFFGVGDFNFKIFSEEFKEASPQNFLIWVFLIATFCTALLALKERQKITLKDILFGVGLGLLNIAASYFMLLALKIIPGHLAYPIHGIGCIMVSAVSGVLIWKEKLTKRQYLFLIFAIAACVLLNLDHL